MKKTLFLFTIDYPFNKQESYIENEIEFLANAFDKILIFPVNSSTIQRAIPNNAQIVKLQQIEVSWLEVVLKLIAEPMLMAEVISNLFSNVLKNKVLLISIKKAISIEKNILPLIKKNQDTKLYLYSYWLDNSAIAISFIKHKGAVKIVRAHGWDIYSFRHLYNYLPLRTFISKRVNKIFAISENGKNYLSKTFRGLTNLTVARLGVINDTLLVNNEPSEKLKVLTISGAIPLKRLPLVGDALKLLNNKNITWEHFGDGPEIEELKKAYPYCFFHGQVSNATIKKALHSINNNAILINTSTSEGLPVSMMEAMSFGIPCIGTDVGGVNEIIKHGVNGYLMPANPTSNEVASFILKFTNLNILEKLAMKLEARNTWDEKFNARKNYTAFISEFLTL